MRYLLIGILSVQMKRRNFIQNSLVTTTGLLLPKTIFSHTLPFGALGANDRIRVGAIGINGMGWSDAMALMTVDNVEIVALCDVDSNVLEKRSSELLKKGIRVRTYTNYRYLLDQKDIDVVVIGTPDHWHALMMIEAATAGKHVYCEKPIGNSIGECRAMVAAQKHYGIVAQVGQWQRSQQHFMDAIDYVHSGLLGPIRTVKVWCYQGWMRPAQKVSNSPVPKGVDYRSWLGPAPLKEFNTSRFHFNFRWFWDYAGGLMTDWGVHLIDYALLGMKAATPKSIVSLGGQFAYPGHAQETPDTLTALYEFENFNMIWDSAMGIDNGSYGRDHGISFIGNNGTLILDRGGWEVIEERQSKDKVLKPFVKSSDNGLQKHAQNFIDAVRANNPDLVNCSIQQGAHVATVAQMGNIAYLSDQKLYWEAAKNQFTDPIINENFLTKKYHNGFVLPNF